MVVGVVIRVNVSWWSKQGQRDCTLLLLYVLLRTVPVALLHSSRRWLVGCVSVTDSLSPLALWLWLCL